MASGKIKECGHHGNQVGMGGGADILTWVQLL